MKKRTKIAILSLMIVLLGVTGYLNIVLHAHLPYVRHPESEEYIEERWLFEAISETYIPLLIYFQKFVNLLDVSIYLSEQ